MSATILLIDYNSLARPIWENPENHSGNPDSVSIAIVSRVRSLASGQSRVGLCLDTPPYFRAAIDAGYKAKRAKPEELATYYHQRALALDTLRDEDGLAVLGAKGYEADDIIASAIASPALALIDEGWPQFLIATADKDLAQLVSPSVRIHGLRDGHRFGVAEVEAKFKVTVGQLLDYFCLVGDSSDNIKGADKIGPVGASGLLAEFGSCEALFAALDKSATIPTITANLRSRLLEFRERYQVVKSLIQLRTDAPCDFAAILAPRGERDVMAFGDDADYETTEPNAGTGNRIIPPGEFFAGVASAIEPNGDVVNVKTGEVLDTLEDVMPNTPPRAVTQMFDERGIVDEIPAVAGVVAKGEADSLTKTIDRMAEEEAYKPWSAPPESAEHLADRLRHAGHTLTVSADGKLLIAPQPKAEDVPAIKQHRDYLLSIATKPVVVPTLATVEQPTTALATVEYERQLEPVTLQQADALAHALYKSRLFTAFGPPEGVLATILAGREFGMPAMASLRGFHIIDSKPSMSAGMIHALVLKSGKAKFFRCTERTNERATFETQRGDDPPLALSYTIEDATKAGMVKSGSGWAKNPADMLVARTISKLARLVYPDVVGGLYSPEEFDSNQ